MTTTSSAEGVAAGLDARVWLRWNRLRSELERRAVSHSPHFTPALKRLHGVAYPNRGMSRSARTVDPVIVLHAATLTHVWNAVLNNPRLGGVYRTRLMQVQEAQRTGNAEVACALLDSLTHGGSMGELEARPALLLLRAVLRFQCQMRQAARQDLETLQKAGRAHLNRRPRIRMLVQHLLGLCCLDAGESHRAMILLQETAKTAFEAGDVDRAAYATIDVALAQADLGGDGILDTLMVLGEQLPGLLCSLRPDPNARLRKYLCRFAGSRDVHLVKALGALAFHDWPISPCQPGASPDLHSSSPAGQLIRAISAMLTLLDQEADLSGVCDQLFPTERGYALGLSEHPLLHMDRLQMTVDDAIVLPWLAQVAIQAAALPQVAEAALEGGPSFCMVLRLMGRPDLALYVNVCLEHLSRRRGPVSKVRGALALQRGFLLFSDGRVGDAEVCFEFALRLIRYTGQSFSAESSLAMLGLGLCDHMSGRPALARYNLWAAYAASRIAPRGETQTWRSAFALSIALNVETGDGLADLRREAALLLDKVSIQEMLKAYTRDPDAHLPGSAEWFPSMRQALSSLVALGRIVEAEAVRDAVRAASVDALTSANPVQRAAIDVSILSESEDDAWETAMREVDRDIAELKRLVAPAAYAGLTPGMAREQRRRIAALWTALPDRLDKALMDAARRLALPDAADGAAVEPAAGPALLEAPRASVTLRDGEALIGYLVHARQLVITLQLPGRPRVAVNVPVGAEELQRGVLRLRRVCSDASVPLERVQEEALQVYRYLLAPVRHALDDAGISAIGVAPHEFIDLVPFAALWDGTQFMAECFAWSLRRPTAAGAASQAEEDFTSLDMALFGATDFTHEQVALPGVALELHRIASDAHPRTTVWTGQALTAQALLDTLANPAVGIVHVATHAFFDPRDDAKSCLELGHGARLSLPELRKGLQRPLSLLVLAACSTGARGPVRDSIASSFMRCGARRVLATQWQIHDASSSWLMPLFYRELGCRGHTPAQALRAAQRSFINGDAAYARWNDGHLAPTRLSPTEFRHPRWWAPFTLFQ